jgi:polar amino acid transport system substrate-binding protein
MVADPKMKDFEELLPPDDMQPWGLAIALNHQGTPYERFLKDTVIAWHRDGMLLALEKKWGLAESEWLRNARAQLK